MLAFAVSAVSVSATWGGKRTRFVVLPVEHVPAAAPVLVQLLNANPALGVELSNVTVVPVLLKLG